MTPPDEIVITGLGLVTSLGPTPQATWDGVLAGRSSLGPMAGLEQRPVPDKGGGQAVDLPPDPFGLPRAARYLRHAITCALAQAGTDVPAERVGVVLGTTLHGMRAGGDYLRSGDAGHLRRFLAGSVLDDALSGLEIAGPRLTTCSACSSGLGSIALGVTLLDSGVVDMVVAGGYDSVSEYSYAGFDSLRLIAAGPPRPFAADRDGMKVAEGYGVLVLERAGGAVARGAATLAVVAGFGESSDAFHLTQPHPEGVGAAQAIRRALSAAGVEPPQIDMVSAHATATPNNDAAEYAGLAAALGPSLGSTPVAALKSHLGHTLGGAGAVELVLSTLAIRSGTVPPTAGTYEADAAFSRLSLVRGEPLRRPIRTTLNLSLGFGGVNTAVVLRDQPSRGSAGSATAAPNEPVITGLGVILPGALDRTTLAALLRDGPLSDRDLGPVPEEQYAGLINARRTRRMSEYAKLTLAATSAALAEASVAGDSAFLPGCSAVLGSTHGSSPFCEAYYSQIVREGVGAANPVLFAEGVPNAAAAHLSMTFGIQGGCQTIIGARRAGLEALMLAALRIRQGLWDRAVVGAAEEYSPVVNSAYAACGLYGGPEGFVTGSGAVALVLEHRAAAEARGAAILASLGDACWSGRPEPRAATEVVRRLRDRGNVAAAWAGVAPDRAARTLLARSGATEVGPTPGRLPEMFSVGPLATLAAVLGSGTPGSFVLLGTEFSGAAAGVLVTPGPGDASGPESL